MKVLVTMKSLEGEVSETCIWNFHGDEDELEAAVVSGNVPGTDYYRGGITPLYGATLTQFKERQWPYVIIEWGSWTPVLHNS